MNEILTFIGAYKRLYKQYPKFVVSPEHAGKTLYVMGDDIGDIHAIREASSTFMEYISAPSAIASTTPPLEIPIVAEEPQSLAIMK